MENEFGISCPPGLPKDQYQVEFLDEEKLGSALRSSSQSHQGELEKALHSQMEEEKIKVPAISFSCARHAVSLKWREADNNWIGMLYADRDQILSFILSDLSHGIVRN